MEIPTPIVVIFLGVDLLVTYLLIRKSYALGHTRGFIEAVREMERGEGE